MEDNFKRDYKTRMEYSKQVQSISSKNWKKIQFFSSFFFRNSFNSSKSERKRNKCKTTFKIIYSICTSHFGLIILLIMYTLIGAAIFHAIEGTQEGITDAEKLTVLTNDSISALVNALISNSSLPINTSHVSEIENIVRSQLLQFNQQLDGNFLLWIEKPADERWDFLGSMLYCMTVFTTIGIKFINFAQLYNNMLYMFTVVSVY